MNEIDLDLNEVNVERFGTKEWTSQGLKECNGRGRVVKSDMCAADVGSF